MDDLTPVKGPTSPFEGRSAKVIAVIVIGILVAIIKPWGTTAPVPLARATAAPTVVAETPRPGSPTPFDAFAGYDHELFGIYEPEPRWELWPAGYLVSFGYAVRIGSTGTDDRPPPVAPGASASPDQPVASPARTPRPTKPGTEEPNWPATITITDGNHLGLIGVNTPLGYKVTSIGVARLRPNGADEPLQVVTPESQWPDHFTVIGLAEGTGRETIENWPAGQYRLDLSFEPGAIKRSIAIVVSASSPADAEATPAPSAPSGSPAPSAP